VKFSLISATSICALLTAAASPSHAGVLNPASGPTSIYDLVRDGNTSSDGGDRTVLRQDPLVTAVAALEASSIGWQQASFTGPADLSVSANTVFPRVPLGAAPGTRPDDDFATPISGAWHWNAWQKSLAVGMARIAPLVGTIGTGPAGNDKPGSTVFVAEGTPAGFNPNVTARSASVMAFAPSSTSTATITVAGAGNFRQRSGSGFSAVAANSLQAMPVSIATTPQAVALADTAQPTLGYQYAPAPNPATKPNLVQASFSNAVSGSGVLARVVQPAATAGVQTSQPRPGEGQTATKDFAATYAKLIDMNQPIEGKTVGTQVDGTRTFLSASVSANPATAAATYMANVVYAAANVPAGHTVEAFQIGPTAGPRAQGNAGTSVADPLHGKVMASVGALNNSLALP
jgi:hypothetical protein